MKSEISLGLIGAGRWGQVLIKTIREVGGARLTALASGNPQSHEFVPADCTITADWRELVTGSFSADVSLDGLIIAAPPAAHEDIVLAAIEASLPVLVEKPLTLSARGAALIYERAKTASVLVMVEHTYLYHPAYRALKQHLGTLGGAAVVTSIKATGGNCGPYRNDVPVLWDWGPHDISMCLDLMEARPSDHYARILEQRLVDGGYGEAIGISLSFPGGARADIQISNLSECRERRLEVFSGDELLIYDDTVDTKLVRRSGPGALPVPLSYASRLPVTVAIEEFVSAVRSGQVMPENLDLAVDVVGLLEILENSMAKI